MQEKLKSLFNTLHDGVIFSCSVDKSQLNLKIGCQYLAEKINPSFDYFHLQLIQVERIMLEPWMNQETKPQDYNTSLQEIFKSPLEIKSSEIKGNLVVVYCSQNNPDFNSCGGNLFIKCEDARLLDQEDNEITLEELKILSDLYWEDFDKN